MKAPTFDQLTRLFTKATQRRTAIAAAMAGLATLPGGAGAARQRDESGLDAQRRCCRRGPRGKRGRPGPSAGAGIKVESKFCTVDPGADQAVDQLSTCIADCPEGLVAAGGGFTMQVGLGPEAAPRATIFASEPNETRTPTRWRITIRFAGTSTDTAFTFGAYAMCLPT